MSCCQDCEYEDGKGSHDDCGNPQCECHGGKEVKEGFEWTGWKSPVNQPEGLEMHVSSGTEVFHIKDGIRTPCTCKIYYETLWETIRRYLWPST